ncbi:MAG: NAD(P)H-dependent oxidoreductase [Pseudomonadota bacterium]
MLLGICGSLRKDSQNAKLMREAARIYGGPFVEGDIRMPLYDGDLEDSEGVPAATMTLAEQMVEAEAILLVTPEYNQSFSGSLKNALDWLSRTKLSPWKDKPVAMLSATAGRTGGARAQYALRLAMNAFRPDLLTGPEILIAGSAKEFDENDRLTNDRYIAALTELMEALRAKAQS